MVRTAKDESLRIFFLFSAVFLSGFALWAFGNLAVTGYAGLDDSPSLVEESSVFGKIQENLLIQTTGVDSCRDLNVSGETYVLTADLTSASTCFNFRNSSIILDCDGNTINSSGIFAVDMTGFFNNTVKNCNIFHQPNISNNEYAAINIKSTENNSAVNNNITNLQSGFGQVASIRVASSSGSNLTGNLLLVQRGGMTGIHLSSASSTFLDGNQMRFAHLDDGSEGTEDFDPVNITARSSSTIDFTWSPGNVAPGDNYTIMHVKIARYACDEFDNEEEFLSEVQERNISSTSAQLTGLDSGSIYGLTVCAEETIFGTFTVRACKNQGLIVNTTSAGSESFPEFLTCPDDEGLNANGLVVEGSSVSQFHHIVNNITNLIEKKPILYYSPFGFASCPNNAALNNPNASHISLINCNNVTLNNFISKDPLTLVNTTNSVVANSSINSQNQFGARLLFGSNNITLENNVLTSTANPVIHLSSSHGARLINNTVTAREQFSNVKGISLESSHGNTLIDNFVSTNGSSSMVGLYLGTSSNNNLTGNTFLAGFNLSIDTISYFGSANDNNTFLNTRIGIDNSNQGNNYIFVKDGNTNNNYTNTTFFDADGSVRFPGTFTLPSSSNLSGITSGLISSNNLKIRIEDFVNGNKFGEVLLDNSLSCSINLNFLNQSAEITFNNVSFNSNKMFVNFDTVEFFDVCSAPQCNNVSFTSTGGDFGRFVFNVSSFTMYSTHNVSGDEGSFGNLSVTSRSGTEIGLEWTLINFDPADLPLNVFYGEVPSASCGIEIGDFLTANQTGLTTNTTTITGLSPSTHYVFIVCAPEEEDDEFCNGHTQNAVIALTTPGGTESNPTTLSCPLEGDEGDEEFIPAGFSGSFSETSGAFFNGPVDRGQDNAEGVVTDSAGNVYVVGTASQGTFCGQNRLIIKYSPAGTVLTSEAISSFSSTSSATEPDLDEARDLLYVVDGSSIFRYNMTNLSLLGSSSISGFGDSLAVKPSGEIVYVIGYTFSSQSYNNLINVRKLNSSTFSTLNSTALGNATLQSDPNAPSSSNTQGGRSGAIAYDNNSNVVYAVGTLLNSSSNSSILILKYDENLTLLATTNFSSSALFMYKGHGIAVHPATGDVYAIGTFGTGEEDADENSTIVLRYDSSLNLLAQREFDGSHGDIDIDGSGNIYIGGHFGIFRENITDLSVISCEVGQFSDTHWIEAYNSSDVYFTSASGDQQVFRVLKRDLSSSECDLFETTTLPVGPSAESAPSSGGGGGGGGSCSSPWVCSDWAPSTCADGVNQARECTCACPNQADCTGDNNETNICPQVVAPAACQEKWLCSDWNSCGSDGKQSRTCSDQNSCGTTKSEPAKLRECIPVPTPAPPINLATVILSSIAAILIFSVIAMSSVVIAQKKKIAGQLYQVIDRANVALSTGDKASALNGYKILKEYFTRYQKKVTKKDLQKLHGEGMKLYENLSK